MAIGVVAALGLTMAMDLAWAERHPGRAAEELAFRRERRVIRKDFGHKVHATPETAYRASKVQQGCLARLYEAGDITIEQLAASQEILATHERITSPTTLRTVSLEARVDQSRSGDGGFFEALGAVRREVAYSRWRDALTKEGRIIVPVLSMIVGDCGVAEAARSARMRTARMKRELSGALDLWSSLLLGAIREIDEAELLAAQAGLG